MNALEKRKQHLIGFIFEHYIYIVMFENFHDHHGKEVLCGKKKMFQMLYADGASVKMTEIYLRRVTPYQSKEGQ